MSGSMDASSSTGSDPIGPECDPSKAQAPVDDACGVFVSVFGDDANQGSRAKPVQTIAKAIELWADKSEPVPGVRPAIYLCAEMFESAGVTLPGGAVVYGALDCNATGDQAWIYKGEDPAFETVLTAPGGTVPLRLSPSLGMMTVVSDVHVLANSAPDAMPGISSIAVIANQTSATFVRSVLEAGSGAHGKDEPDNIVAAEDGVMGDKGRAACVSPVISKTPGPKLNCINGGISIGGDGGSGFEGAGFAGGSGSPMGNMNAGKGESAMGQCSNGGPGQKGADGASGEAWVQWVQLGTLDPVTGYVGVAGKDGMLGVPGQGGGGGGGTAASPGGIDLCSGAGLGASGGSGGTGGCGGAGGKGGGPGGSSIAVVSLKSALVFEASRLMVGNGGVAGKGSNGQPGGAAGVGGLGGSGKNGVMPGCAGNFGGSGGYGGKGADGLGGHALGIAFTGQEPKLDNQSKIEPLGMAGAAGVSAEKLEFPVQ
jgi:hypothetical protein